MEQGVKLEPTTSEMGHLCPLAEVCSHPAESDDKKTNLQYYLVVHGDQQHEASQWGWKIPTYSSIRQGRTTFIITTHA